MTVTPIYDPATQTEFLSCNAPPSRPIPSRPLALGTQVWWIDGTHIKDGTVTSVGELAGEPVYSVNGVHSERYQFQRLHPKTDRGRLSLLDEIDVEIIRLQGQRANLLMEELP